MNIFIKRANIPIFISILNLIPAKIILFFWLYIKLPIKIIIPGNAVAAQLALDVFRKAWIIIKIKMGSEKQINKNSFLLYDLIFSRRSDITKFSYQLKLFENKEIKRYYLTLRKKPINHYEYNYNFKDHSLKKNDVVLIINSLDGIDRQYIKYFDKFETIGKTIFKEAKNSVRSYYIIRANMK